MKQIFKIIGISAFMLFSFYYTDKIALYAKSQSPIMKQINDAKNTLSVSSINATITNEYIIPGINGLVINVNDSFNNMKAFKEFNAYYLSFDQVAPEISLENNKGKIIKNGNPKKRAIAFLLEPNKSIMNYLKSNNIKATLLSKVSDFDNNSFFEQINNEINFFEKLESLLNKNNINKKICKISNANEKVCREKEYYLVENSLELNNSNLANIKSKITSGDIILIKESAKVDDLVLLINQIKYQDLNIVYLSELITEENN